MKLSIDTNNPTTRINNQPEMAGILLNLPHRLFLEGRLQPVRRILVAIVTLSSSAIPATTSTLVLQNNRMVAVAVEEKPVPKARGVRENNPPLFRRSCLIALVFAPSASCRILAYLLAARNLQSISISELRSKQRFIDRNPLRL